MKVIPLEIGRAVVSTQGHDKGRAFLIIELIDEHQVLIADGDTHKLAKPKKKHTKHLRTLPILAVDAVSSAQRHAGTADSSIRKALTAATHTEPYGSKRVNRVTNKEEYALVQK